MLVSVAFMMVATTALAQRTEHPLTGSVWFGDASRQISRAALDQHLLDSQYIFIGEIHTNPEHHRFQAQVLANIASTNRRASVVWEMIPRTKQTVLSKWRRGNRSVQVLGSDLDWASSGWPDWSIYQPIARVAQQYDLSMLGAGLDRTELREVSRQGFDSYSALQRLRLGLDKAWPPLHEQSMLEALRTGHCDLMPADALKGMLNVQRLRDSEMAATMLQGSGKAGAVLIAGNGHIRKDWAVPAVLRAKRPHATSVSVAQIEVEEGKAQPAQYQLSDGAGPLYDFVLFTPKHDFRDHCAELRQQMKRPAR